MSLPMAFDDDRLATVAGATAALRAAFERAGLPGAARDARLLVAFALRSSPSALLARSGGALTEADRRRIDDVMRRRLERAPVSRILGVREFWGLPLALSPATLDPRPDTETVVEAALALIGAAGTRSAPLAILDLGTGSGALVLALLSELPRARGVGVDRDPAAAATAALNARALGLDGRARFLVADWTQALAGSFDLVVSNPPYVRSADIERLEPEVRDHDPRLALDGGADGLDAYRAILRRPLVAPAGHLVVEVGLDQAAPVRQLLAASFPPTADRAVRTFRDLAGVERVVAASPRR